jgi:hypothetical protein
MLNAVTGPQSPSLLKVDFRGRCELGGVVCGRAGDFDRDCGGFLKCCRDQREKWQILRSCLRRKGFRNELDSIA